MLAASTLPIQSPRANAGSLSERSAVSAHRKHPLAAAAIGWFK